MPAVASEALPLASMYSSCATALASASRSGEASSVGSPEGLVATPLSRKAMISLIFLGLFFTHRGMNGIFTTSLWVLLSAPAAGRALNLKEFRLPEPPGDQWE